MEVGGVQGEVWWVCSNVQTGIVEKLQNKLVAVNVLASTPPP